MTVPRRRMAGRWGELLLTSGLAAIISGTLSFVGIFTTQSREQASQRCQLAAQMLQDDTLSPYISVQARQRLSAISAEAFRRCLEAR